MTEMNEALKERLEREITHLEEVRESYWEPTVRLRLSGKIEGVRLALSYLEEETR